MEQEEIKIGDFVQAIWVGDGKVVKEGVVTKIHPENRVSVKSWNFESLCFNPQIIKKSQLTAKQRDLISWVKSKRG